MTFKQNRTPAYVWIASGPACVCYGGNDRHGAQPQGSKIPVITGRFDKSTRVAETQMTYLDVGLNFDAAEIKSRIERSSVVEDKPSTGGVQNPSLRQTLLDSVTYLPLSKQVTLGSLDPPDSTHRMDVEVKLEMVP